MATLGPGRMGVHPSRSRQGVGLFALAVLVLTVACGGGDDEPDALPTQATARPTQVIVPTQPPPQPTTEPAAPLEHVVEPGETLSTIAEAFGVTVEAIVAANEIENPDLIAVGERLIIPPPTTEAATPTPTP